MVKPRPVYRQLLDFGLGILCLLLFMPVWTRSTEAAVANQVVDNVTTQPSDMRLNPDTGKGYTSSQGILAASGRSAVTAKGQDFINESGANIKPYVTNSNDAKPWFVMNYIAPAANQKPGYIHFADLAAAQNFTPNYNANQSVAKQAKNALGVPILKANQSYEGGYLNVAGNVPITVTLNPNRATVLDLMTGNWGVMVRVSMPDDVDPTAIANAIDWEQAYFNLTISGLGLASLAGTFNYPLQFDHHVYLDPKDASSFYLKVKGIPFNIDYKDGSITFNSNSASFHLKTKDQDGIDYQNNVYLNNGQVATQLEKDGTQATNSLLSGYQAWNLRGSVNNLGKVGSASVIINLLQEKATFPGSKGLFESISSVLKMLTSDGFNGNAAINFNIDMAAYNGNRQKQYKPLTKGRLMPSPYADGQFNQGDGLGSNRRAVGISMYGTEEMYDPFGVGATTATEAALKQKLNNTGNWIGNLPIDYAVVKDDSVQNGGTAYPVYTPFSSWNAFVAPFDNQSGRDTITPSASRAVPDISDTASTKASEISQRTATPDPVVDGLLVNDGVAFSPKSVYDVGNLAPVLTQGIAGAVTPQRYAQVYRYYNFDKSTPNLPGAVNPQRIVDDTLLTLQVKTANASVSGGVLNPAITSGQWTYGGTYNQIPILGTTLKLKQSSVVPKVNLNLPDSLVVTKSQLAAGQTSTYDQGQWVDAFANQDILEIQNESTGTGKVLGGLNRNSQGQKIKLTLQSDASSSIQAQMTDNDGNIDVTLGLAPTVGMQNFTFQLTRPQGINVANKWQTAASATDVSTQNLRVYVVDDTQTQQVALTKNFVLGSDPMGANRLFKKTYVNQNGSQAIVAGTIKNLTSSPLSAVTILIPAVSGTTLAQPLAGLMAGGKVTVTQGVSPMLGYQLYTLTPQKPWTAGQLMNYSYIYNVTDIQAVPNLSQLTDYALAAPETLNFVGVSNTIELSKDVGLHLMRVPNLNFSKHALPSTTQTYVNEPRDYPSIVVYDNRTALGDWTLRAQLSPFKNASGQLMASDQSSVTIDFGAPNLDNELTVVAQTAAKLPANEIPGTIYTFDADNSSNPQAQTVLDYGQGDNNIELTVPGHIGIKAGKYAATVTYSLTDSLD